MTEIPDRPEDMTTAQIAEATGLHPNTVRADINAGILPARRVAGINMVDGPTAVAYIEYRKQVTAAKAALEGLRETTKERKIRRDQRR